MTLAQKSKIIELDDTRSRVRMCTGFETWVFPPKVCCTVPCLVVCRAYLDCHFAQIAEELSASMGLKKPAQIDQGLAAPSEGQDQAAATEA